MTGSGGRGSIGPPGLPVERDCHRYHRNVRPTRIRKALNAERLCRTIGAIRRASDAKVSLQDLGRIGSTPSAQTLGAYPNTGIDKGPVEVHHGQLFRGGPELHHWCGSSQVNPIRRCDQVSDDATRSVILGWRTRWFSSQSNVACQSTELSSLGAPIA